MIAGGTENCNLWHTHSLNDSEFIQKKREDPWKNRKYKIGDLVKGKVTKLASFGAFVQLQDGIDGLVHISQLSEDHVAKVKDVFKVGQEVEARVIKVDKVEGRIGLSIKAAIIPKKNCARNGAGWKPRHRWAS